MKVSVNKDLCAGCELCVSVCPEVFVMAEGKSSVKADAPLSDPKIAESAKQAVEMCPSQAILVTE